MRTFTRRRSIFRACSSMLESLETRRLLAEFNPTTAAALSTALSNAQLGDTIILQAGTTYEGWFTLPNKPMPSPAPGNPFITIRSSKVDQLPEGTRVTPADAADMPKLQSNGNNASVIKTATSAHHYKFIGIEFVGPRSKNADGTTKLNPDGSPANGPNVTALMSLGAADSTQTTIDEVPNNILIDRCYFRPFTPDSHIRRAIALNSASTDITNSWIEEIHEPGSDSQAIGGWSGAGPYNIINNHLEGASENIMFGGDRSHLMNIVPTGIVIRNNHIIKPLHWRTKNYNVKNLFELKHGRDVLVESNVMENNWVQGQSGVAIVLKLGDRLSTPWNVTENVTLRNNIIRGSNGSVAIQGRDYDAGTSGDPGGNVRNISIVNNLFDDINGKWSTSGAGKGTFNILITHGPKNVTFDHNTFVNGGTAMEIESTNVTYPMTNFKFTNNIIGHSEYGVRSTSGTGNNTFSLYMPNVEQFRRNLLVDVAYNYRNNYTSRPDNLRIISPNNDADPPAAGDTTAPGYTADAYLYDNVGFIDRAAGNFRLAPTIPGGAPNPYINAGLDGKDLGAVYADVEAATATAISGVPAAVVDTDPPTVTARGFQGQTGPAYVSFTFSEPVTIAAANLSLTNLDTAGSATPTVSSMQWDGNTNTARFLLANLPDANFRATLVNVKDPAGNALTGINTQDFSFLNGDANLDRKVNALDFNALASSFGTAGSGVSSGDFNLDGTVNTADFTAMASRWAKALAPAPAAPAGLGAAQASTRLFSAESIEETSILDHTISRPLL